MKYIIFLIPFFANAQSIDTIRINMSDGLGGIRVVKYKWSTEVPTNSIIGRTTAGVGVPQILNVASVKTLLGITNVEDVSINTWAGSSNITTLGTISGGIWQGTSVKIPYLDTTSGGVESWVRGLKLRDSMIAVNAATYSVLAHTHTYSSITSNPSTTVGNNLFTLTNPSAITFLRINADNTVTARSAANFKTDLSLTIGTDVQAFDADLTTWAGITPGANVGTFLATPSSANLRSAVTDENGTGAALFNGATTPDFTTGVTIGGAAASGKILKGNGTNFIPSTETYADPGTSGNIMMSDGTNWTSAVMLPSKVASADIAATASATSTTTLFTPTADGMYRISVYMKITTTGTSPVAGPVTITYTDADGSVAQSHVMLLQSVTGTVVTTTVNNSTTTGTVTGTMIVNAKNAVAIRYAIAVSRTFGAGRYTAHFTCERVK